MSDKRFHIIFQGRIDQGASPEAVRENLGRLFRMDAARVEALFSGQRVVIKRDADQATMMKFRAAMKQAGALCEVEEVGVPEPPVPAQAAVASGAAAPPRGGDLVTVGTLRTGGTGFSGPFDVAEAGSVLSSGTAAPPAAAPDISHLSMAPAGTDLEELPRAAAVPVPDLSHLSVAPAGADLSGND
ncbi:hypothetical protein A167_00648 [Alcanivorax sp. S71-1-4]|uniref:hypothetical protein n=1 Tax=Alcanivorax sp. S71-1-4 TaxID=1177159 RepID=UPI00135BF4D3|nr:hypothetical protein [Alcanivorax sp. S71-1-4]KAF0810368.1 hypothetical protein A167_00648 [Alcanivorax sp. S71-1-4]